MFIAAFNHLVPFPGTPLYRELQVQGRLRYPKWWLSDEFYFGQVPFNPEGISADKVEHLCHKARTQFYGICSILKRALDVRCNAASLSGLFRYISLNVVMKKEVHTKRGIPLGIAGETQ